MGKALPQYSRWIDAAFYRGGTSRGLVMRDHVISRFSQADRDRILCQASSPDPDGRQIDGLGGGTSSTSKVAIVSHSRQVYASYARTQGLPLPGLDWIDDTSEVEKICDVIYRAGQVSILDHKIDWSSTCGNMMAAVAHFSLSFFKFTLPASIPPPFRNGKTQKDTTYIWPLRILAHDTGKIFTAHVPVRAFTFISDDPTQKSNYTIRPALEGSSQIAGVPGRAPGILIESPLVDSVLPTGNERDTIEFEGKQIDVSIVDTGLPVVFVSAKSLDIPLSSLLDHPAAIDSNKDLMAKLEQVRQRACTLSPNLKISPPSPKLCVVHPRCEYITTGGQKVAKDSMDLLIRTVSTGQLHRTVPATTLAALAASTCFGNSIIAENVVDPYPCDASQAAIQEDVRAITVGQPAGCSTAMVKVKDGLPVSTLMTRTARHIMNGSIPTDPKMQLHPAHDRH